MQRHLLALFLMCAFHLQAQQYSRVKIDFDANHQITDLAKMGLDVDHGRYQPGKYFIGEFADFEILQMQNAGFQTEILVENLVEHLHHLNATESSVVDRDITGCGPDAGNVYETPQNYTYGTMGGYHTYDEMLDVLDQMAAMYPDYFKEREPITTAYTTHDGNPVYWVKISDNPNVDETDEPEVLITALHHAREPNGLSQMIFFMWYMLENYDNDPEIKYIMDNVEMYFIPCVNPDGYLYNETTNPDGGGFWRKNRRDNGNGDFGVDLNRNYPYEWGFDDQGSSPNTGSQTYRGPGPGSEPETMMLMEFCEAHEFQIAQNYHTFSNLLIYPWSFADAPTPDALIFRSFGDLMTQDNNYLSGTPTQTVGYTVNGSSDDWMYGEQSTKEKIYSMTPEVGPGSTGFWPPQGDIDGLNKDAMTINMMTARLVLNFGEAVPFGGQFISNINDEFQFNLKKIGLKDGPLTVSIAGISNNVVSVGAPKNFGLFHLEETTDGIAFTLDPAIQEGEVVSFELTVSNGEHTWTQQVDKIYSTDFTEPISEAGDDLTNWATFGNWALTDESFYSAPTSITDSPGDLYEPFTVSEITYNDNITVISEETEGVYLSFWTKWDIEEDEDYVQVIGIFNNGGSVPLCGNYTENGTQQQAFDEPLYDGLQDQWVQEEIDLTEYLDLGDEVDMTIAFRLITDEFIEHDGFYFDDVTLTVVKKAGSTSTFHLDRANFTIESRPNPATEFVVLEMKGDTESYEGLNLHIFNGLGQLVSTERIRSNTLRINTADWQSGLYEYQVEQGGMMLPMGRFMVVE